MDALVSKEIFYDYRLPNGRRVVIWPVPALCDPDGEYHFKAKVVDRLAEPLIAAASVNIKVGYRVEIDYKTGEANFRPEN